ncbi:MAG: hypothetical protein ABTQ28_03015, partial [Thauera sp.]
WWCGSCGALAHEVGEGRHFAGVGEAAGEIGPEGGAEHSAGFLQTAEGVAALAAEVTAGTTADFAHLDVSDIG